MTTHYWNTKKLLEEMNSQSHNQMVSMLRMDARTLRFRIKCKKFNTDEYYTLKERVQKTFFLLYGRKLGVSYAHWNTNYDY